MSEHDGCDTIRTFWHGTELSIYEELALASFVKQGHAVQLFSYQRLRKIEGVEQIDASSILPANELFCYEQEPGKGSFSAFSNLFRYKVLHELGGTWVDADVLCLKSFSQLPPTCVGRESKKTLSTAVMRFPPRHPITKELYERAKQLGRNVVWGQIGPKLFTEVVLQNPVQVEIMQREAFIPITWPNAWKLIYPPRGEACATEAADSFCVHWWNEILRRIGVDKSKAPPAGSYLRRHANAILGEEWLTALSEQGVDGITQFLALSGNPHVPA